MTSVLDVAFWQAHKERIKTGHVLDVFQYEHGKQSVRRREGVRND